MLPLPKTSPHKGQDGFTLIEVLIAAALIILGLVMYAMFIGNVVTQNDESLKESTAITLAQDKIEEIKNIARTVSLAGADGLDSPAYTTSWSATAGGEVVDSEGNTGTSDILYTRTWTISDDPALYYFYNVDVTVSWDSGAKSVTVNTQISQ